MSLPMSSAPLPVNPAPSPPPATGRARVDDGSMRLVERAIALLAVGAAVLVSLAR